MAGACGTQALSRNLDKVLEEAQLTGQLSLHARNIRAVPAAAHKFDLTDTVFVGNVHSIVRCSNPMFQMKLTLSL